MALESIALQSETAKGRKISEIKNLRFAVPVVNLIFRVQVIQSAEYRPPNILEEQLLRVLMPSCQINKKERPAPYG